MNSEKLIQIVRKHKVLYDMSHPHYGDSAFKQKQWDKIADLMDAEVNDCKLKWICLRNSYSRILRNRRQSRAGPEQKDKWYLAEEMSFLKDHMQQRRPRKNSDVEICEEDSVPSIVEDIKVPINNISFDALDESSMKSSYHSDSVKQKKRKFPTEETANQLIDLEKNNVNKTPSENPLIIYVQGLLPDYEKLTAKRQRTFKKKLISVINDLLDEQEMVNGSV